MSRMTTLFTFVATTLSASAGCSVDRADERTAGDEMALSDECAPGDADCKADPCAPDDAACHTPCAADDANCNNPCDPADAACHTPCAPDDPKCTLDCGALAKEVTELLAAAQSCNVAVVSPNLCATFVPSIDGCSQPVAYPGSEETKKYLDLFQVYAEACPLPDPPCQDPTTFSVMCAQDADIDGLLGRCAIVDDDGDKSDDQAN